MFGLGTFGLGTTKGNDVSYGYLGSMRTQPGRRDEVVALLLANCDEDAMPGCLQYLVTTDDADADLVWICEVWTDKAAHDVSLTLPAVRATIAQAMPLLTGDFTSHEVTVRGGIGAPA